MAFFQQQKQALPNTQAQQPKGGMLDGLIGGKAQPPSAQANGGVLSGSDAYKDMVELSRKSRINEERIVSLRNKQQMIEHNMLQNHKRLLTEIKFINEEIMDIKRQVEDFKAKIMIFARELQESAKKEDIEVLERYISFWEPVHFTSRKEVDRMISERLEEAGFGKTARTLVRTESNN